MYISCRYSELCSIININIFNGNMNKKNEKERLAKEIVDTLCKKGYRALYAGGYVRDMILGTAYSGDIDIATNARPEEISRVFPDVARVGEHFGVMIVRKKNIAFEVATFRSDIGTRDGRHPEKIEFVDEQTDAMRRDFTINGLFFDPEKRELLDYVSGKADLEKGIIRAIGNPAERFCEDYLRLLRAIRFAARFSYTIEKKTWNAMCASRNGIRSIAPERIFQELDKLLRGPKPDSAITLLHESGLLALVLPEVEALRGVPQPEEFHPEGDVFAHTVKALSLLENPGQCAAWSVLLHDIGKPGTLQHLDRIRFNNHHRLGADMARRALKRLKASGSLIDCVCACIDNHMNFMNVQKMRLSTLKKFLARPTFDDEMLLHKADCIASHGDLENYHFLQEKKKVFTAEMIKPEPLLRGADLIEAGLTPGPVFGKILKEAYDLQLEEYITDREQALKWLREKAEKSK
ncbi:MAG: HD domain-containing protein [Chitinivibrionales bacterium]|nr:HD domain-containing protein [Chitinivibrionales bacterium]